MLSVERNLIEYVLYRLVAAKLVLSTNDQRYVTQSLVEVEDAVDRLRSVAGARERAIGAIARQLGASQLTLGALAEQVPPAERYMLIELQSDYVRLAHQIAQVSSENRRLVELSLGPTAELLKQVAGVPTGAMYDGAGSVTNDRPNPVRVDEAI